MYIRESYRQAGVANLSSSVTNVKIIPSDEIYISQKARITHHGPVDFLKMRETVKAIIDTRKE